MAVPREVPLTFNDIIGHLSWQYKPPVGEFEIPLMQNKRSVLKTIPQLLHILPVMFDNSELKIVSKTLVLPSDTISGNEKNMYYVRSIMRKNFRQEGDTVLTPMELGSWNGGRYILHLVNLFASEDAIKNKISISWFKMNEQLFEWVDLN